ncbi:heavy metal translocating P-type ATPase [Aureibacter tunicatorum]|uniref:P-type Zn(2+) transporter n=1 Tax=Aureibacter tunicatorum TaxID=866807 RepID=A0AAE3XNV2_9BACT|nr:heavy metal translocating P-type ATPase [Aureibacter tunicatorum]MDR6239191.1 Cd2+/Zn2+-exporting ATPase [Aureibacter tunicatorum]BDD04883.1 ATPase [Aureibacter tunicatorum]
MSSHHHHCDHHHTHIHFLGKNSEIKFSIICGIFLLAGFLLDTFNIVSKPITIGIFLISYIFGSFYAILEAYETMKKGKFDIEFLMLVAAIGAAVLDKWAEGALLLFLFSLGHSLEHYAMNKARNAIKSLANLSPKTAFKKTENGKITEIDINEINIGDTLIVKPHTKIPADGKVNKGRSYVNQASITGESMPVLKTDNSDKKEHIEVFAGTINGDETLEILATKKAEDFTISRLVKLISENQAKKSPTQKFADKFEKIYVPIVLGLVILLNFAFLLLDELYVESFYRSMAMLVAASPCALAISTPSAVLSGISRAAQKGILVKGGKALEALGQINFVAFDKTGTLTIGEPKITEIITFGNTTQQELLEISISAEMLSDHPIAKAIVKDGIQKLGKHPEKHVTNLVAHQGKGISAEYQGKILIGQPSLFESLNIPLPSLDELNIFHKLEAKANTSILVYHKDKYLGIISIQDTLRDDAEKTIISLRNIGIKNIEMLSGDNQNVADSIAKHLSIQAKGELLPEEKAQIIKNKSHQFKIAMVGDGVNDAPAMVESDIGIAMGAAGSEVAMETADVALLSDKLSKLPYSIALGRQTRKIIKQNLCISLGVVALLMPLTILGIANIGWAVLIHEGSTMVVVLNALRLLKFNMKEKAYNPLIQQSI